MTVRNDVPNTGRDIHVNRAGVSGRPGITLELAVPTLIEGVDLLAQLVPVPGPADPASLSVDVTGTFQDGVTVPQYVSGNMRFASVLTGDPVNLVFGGNQTVEIGSVLNTSDGGVCALIDGRKRVRAVINSAVPVGADSFGIVVSGACDEVFIELVEGVLLGARAVMFAHTASSPTPIEYDIGVVTFNDAGQVLLRYNPPPGLSETILRISAAQLGVGATPTGTVGSMVIKAEAGVLVVTAEVLQAQYLATVCDGALVVLTAKAAIGATVIEDGGVVVYQSLGRLEGSIDLLGAGSVAQVNTESLAGDFTLASGANASIKTDIMVGDISVAPGARMFCFIDTLLGTVAPSDPGDGRIDGTINGVRYGRWRVLYDIILSAGSLLEQSPAELGQPLQVEFGAAVSTDDADLAADGTITAKKIAQYTPEYTVHAGADNNGGVAFLMFRVTVDGVQLGPTIALKLNGINDDLPVSVLPGPIDLVPGQEVRLEMARRTGFSNDGSLMSTASLLAGWAPVYSATVRLTVIR